MAVVPVPPDGAHVRVVDCQWCGQAAPVYADRRGRPYTTCPWCGSRAFSGVAASIQLAEHRSAIREIVWPPGAKER